ncbi:solute carrier family 25 member 44-like isoform X1 [Canna indica]|uniref:Solute carrier family 25 member 44-like isoform X1 n=1 Tax=Canna indica TaxID=4628 RepID=A0AAQ3JP25_9LILI|nr:solute carrier family 25 member 44-like isoform X1 [Canna indica]
MSFMAATGAEEEEEGAAATAAAGEVHLPAEVDWEMLDKWRFFALGAALFSGVSAALYPAVVLKTRLQVAQPPPPCLRAAAAILRHEGPRGFYRGFVTSLAGTVPARALYMGALEATKSAVGTATLRLGVPEPAASAAASAAAGLSAAVAAQFIWTPIDVVSQRLMVQGSATAAKYRGGVDAFRKILCSDGLRGLYRGFGMSILTYAPSNAVWWASYSLAQRLIWEGVGYHMGSGSELRPGYGALVVVQGASAAVAGGASAIVTMPLDTIKTRMQVLDGDSERMTIGRTVRSLLREGGWGACYRGLGPRWASMSVSATTMITTYEFLKRLSAKEGSL